MDNKKGYIGIGKHYILLSFLVKVSAVVLGLAMAYAVVLHPVAVRWWLSLQVLPEFTTDSPYLAEYSGRARLVLPDGTLLYEGGVTAAAAEGEGKLYENGALIYEGGFEQSMFSGRGRQYSSGGMLIYEGEFSQNERTGQGRYYENGKLVYDGGFLSNVFEGSGKLYENGVLVYDGEFAGGVYNGTGTEYNPLTGYPVFSGKYADGVPMTAGVYYDENGKPVSVERRDPLLLLGTGYREALMYFESAGITVTEQTVGTKLLALDEPAGVIYCFTASGDEQEQYITSVYYYGLHAVGGIVVGADISDTAVRPTGAAEMNTADILVLGYSNARWGRDAQVSDSRGLVYTAADYTVTAYYLPPEELPEEIEIPEEPPEETLMPVLPEVTAISSERDIKGSSGEPDGGESPADGQTGRVLFLRVDRH